MTTLSDKIADLIKPSIEALGFEFWGLVYQVYDRRNVLRVFIEAEKGIAIDDCEQVSRQISSVLDAESLIANAYVLEVSSPGVDRLLFKPAHYQRYLNQEIKVKLYEPIEGQRSFVGKIIKVDADQVELATTTKNITLPFTKIQSAQVVLEQFEHLQTKAHGDKSSKGKKK